MFLSSVWWNTTCNDCPVICLVWPDHLVALRSLFLLCWIPPVTIYLCILSLDLLSRFTKYWRFLFKEIDYSQILIFNSINRDGFVLLATLGILSIRLCKYIWKESISLRSLAPRILDSTNNEKIRKLKLYIMFGFVFVDISELCKPWYSTFN